MSWFVLIPLSLQNAREAESNCTKKTMGERQTGLAMRRSLGRCVIRRGPR